jgi:hypothetical protein
MYFVCPRWNDKALLITCLNIFCAFLGMGCVLSTQVEIHYVS